MNSSTCSSFAKIFVVASWINMIFTLVTYLVSPDRILVIFSLALALFSAACACIFYIFYKRAVDREDLEIIKEIDKYLREKKDE